MSEAIASDTNMDDAAAMPAPPTTTPTDAPIAEVTSTKPSSSRSNIPTPASSVTGIPVSKLKAPSNFGSSSSISKIGRPCCTHTTPKAGPPPRDTNSMSRESDDNLSSINSAYTDLYQETVKRFTRSSLSPTSDWDRFSPGRRSLKSSTPQSDNEHRRTSYDYYLEATGRRRSSDHNSAVLTANTELFIIGQRVWVGGIRSGQIAYIGETHFAPGDWAGIVLDEPNGKNDGCVSGKRYFQCEPKRGIFSRLTRLTLYPLSGAQTPQTPTSPMGKYSPERSRTVSPTASLRSAMLRSPGTGKNGLTVGDRVIVSSGFGSRPGLLRYLGETQFAPGNWCGIELDEASGKNDGAVDGIRYFECKPKYGVFVPIAKVSLSPSSKKTRLSRTGSRESLTSIGTMNSIATTNTSRMRMNAQDLLREKQHHVEQLMVERDLDREDAQNQALQLQKNINELKARIVQLETQLGAERKKSEELQFSIDEAQFCGDELNAQTQVYKEKIHELEKKITQLVTASPSLQSVPAVDENAALLAAQSLVEELQAKLQTQEQQHNGRLSELQDEEQRLLENIKYLQSQNETLQKELVGKDESLEKFSLSECGIENLRRELALLKEENEKQSQQAQADFEQKLASKSAELAKVTDELNKMKSASDTLESERANVSDECEILQTEIRMRDEQLKELSQQVDQLTVQLSVQKADSSALDEMLKAQQMGSAESKTVLEEKIAENSQLKAANEALQQAQRELEEQLGKISEELATLKQQQQTATEQLQASGQQSEAQLAQLSELTANAQALQQQLSEKSAENEQLSVQLSSLTASQQQAQQSGTQLQQQLEQQQQLHAEATAKLQATEALLAQNQQQLEQLQQQSTASSEQDAAQLARLNAELIQLRASLSQTESESHNAASTMSGRIAELEAQTQTLQQRLAQAEAAAQQAEQNHAALLAKHAEQAKQLSSQLETLETSNATLQKLSEEHDGVKAHAAQLEAQLKQSSEACAQRELELGDITRKHEALQSKCEALGQQHETLQTELLAARGSASELQTTLKQLNEDLQSRQRSYAELESQSSGQRLELASDNELLKQENIKLASELNELKQTLSKLKADATEKQAQLSKLEEQNIKQELAISDASRQQQNLQARCEGLTQQNETLQQQLSNMQTTSTDFNAELMKVSQELVAKQKSYEELSAKSSDERATLEGQLQASQQRLDALCSQVELLTQELKTSTEQSSELHAKLKAEQELAGKQSLELSDATRKLEALNAKCLQQEQEQGKLQQDLSSTRNSGTELNAKLLQLTEQLATAQKELATQVDARSVERLQLERELQEARQQVQASQAEALQLQAELVTATESKSLQATEFASLKSELSSKARNELAETQASEANARAQLIADYEQRLQAVAAAKAETEAQLQQLKQQQSSHTEGSKKLQEQISELTERLEITNTELQHKQQLALEDSQKIADLKTLVEAIQVANANISATNAELSAVLEVLQAEKSETAHIFELFEMEADMNAERLIEKLTEMKQELQQTHEQLKGQQNSNLELQQKLQVTSAELLQLQQSEESSNELTALNAEQLRVLQQANEELQQALQQSEKLLQAEKSETAHIIKLFGMEADTNAERLIEKLTEMKEELKQTHEQLKGQQNSNVELQQKLQAAGAELLQLQQSEQSSNELAALNAEQLRVLQQANEELQQTLQQKEKLLEQGNEFDAQLAEYKKVIDEMDDAASSKSKLLDELKKRVAELEAALRQAQEAQQSWQLECKNLKRKLESVELDKARELMTLRAQTNGTAAKLGAGDAAETLDTETSMAKINFLNSIIADMQQKNDALKAKVQTLEMLPTDFTKPHAFDMLTKRKPAPRMFCDICDEFDQHETEDCPLQASEERDYSPPPAAAEANNNDKKQRKLPEKRKYCESCEVFGHDTGECADDETY